MDVAEFQGKVLAELKTLGREIHDLKKETLAQGKIVAAWPATCATFRLRMLVKLVTISVSAAGVIVAAVHFLGK